MKTLIGNVPAELEDALYSLAVADRGPDAGDIDALVREFPEYAEYITDTLVALAVDDNCFEEELKDDHEGSISPAVSRVMSRFNNRLHEVRKLDTDSKVRKYAVGENPFALLERDQLRAIAVGLNANTMFVVKLRDRLIDPETMSNGFKSLVARELATTVAIIVAHLNGPPIVATRSRYKADKRPEALKRQSFKDAVARSGLSDKQQSFLMSV